MRVQCILCCSLPEISAFCRPKELGTQSERKGARFCGGDWQENAYMHASCIMHGWQRVEETGILRRVSFVTFRVLIPHVCKMDWPLHLIKTPIYFFVFVGTQNKKDILHEHTYHTYLHSKNATSPFQRTRLTGIDHDSCRL